MGSGQAYPTQYAMMELREGAKMSRGFLALILAAALLLWAWPELPIIVFD